MNIDLVVLWVDGSDIEHIKQKNKYKALLGQEVTAEAKLAYRFRDNGELKYLLRSIEKNANFIRQIFLVTNGQRPKWLKLNNPKIKIINHNQIMPQTALPTFNSYAIEFCITNIPGLADTFLYANDDFIIAKPISENFFFNKKGYPVSRLKTVFYPEQNIENLDSYDKSIIFTLDLFKKKFNKKFYLMEHHNIDAFYKPDVLNCLKEFQDNFDKTIHYKFRQDKNISKMIWSLYSFYAGHSKIKGLLFLKFITFLVLMKKEMKSLFNKIKLFFNKRQNKNEKASIVNNESNHQNNFINKLIYNKIENKLITKSIVISMLNFNKNDIKDFTLFCVNDNNLATDEDRKQYMNFLNELFPNKSSFEI